MLKREMKALKKFTKSEKLTWTEQYFRKNAKFPTNRGDQKIVFIRNFSKKELEDLAGPLYRYHKYIEDQRPKFDIMDGRALL